jgi:NitT/TauT family transport system ATP-binding protein
LGAELRFTAMASERTLTTHDVFELVMQCPHVSPDEIAGLLQRISQISHSGKTKRTILSKSIADDGERLVAILRVLDMLGLAKLANDTVALTSGGEHYARATAHERKVIFADQLKRNVPWVRLVQSEVAAHPQQEVRLQEFTTELYDRYPASDVDHGLRHVIDWARYSGVFFYDDRTGVIFLQRRDHSNG